MQAGRGKGMSKQIADNIKRICVFGVLLLMVGVCTWGFLQKDDQGTILRQEELFQWTENWQCQGDHTVSLPYKTSWMEGREVVFENVLPAFIKDGWALCYMTNYAAQKVYIGDRLAYSYEIDKNTAIPQNFRALVRLDETDAGETIRLVMTPSYNGDYEMQGVMVGPKDTVLYYLLKINVWRTVAATLILLLSIMILTLSVFHNINAKIKYDAAMSYFSFFMLSFSLWFAIGSDIPQFLTRNGTGCNLVYFLSFTALAPNFIGFYSAMGARKNKFLGWLQWMGFGNSILQIVLFLLGIMDFKQMQWLTICHIVISFFTILMDTLISLKGNREKRAFMIIYLFFMIVCGTSVVAYYTSPEKIVSDAVLGIGTVLFCMWIFYLLESRELAGAREALKSGIYRNMAYTDALTEMANRMALERDVDAILDTVSDGKRIVYVMCDLNRLKYTNDTFGHEAGDELIKNAALCIMKAIPKEAHCYRLGGDEFAVLLAESEITAWYIIQKIEEEMEKYNQTHAIKLSMAMGSATDLLQKNKDGFFKELFKRADDQMYEVKRQQHMSRDQIYGNQ